MQLAGKLRKIENTLKASGSGKYKGACISVWLTDKTGIYLVRGEGIEFETKETDAKEFIKPYQDGGASIIWTNIPHEWAM